MQPFLPPSLRHFDLQPGAPQAATETMPLIYDLVHALRASTIVDLAPGEVWAFRAAAQSLRDHEREGMAYAFDDWASTGEVSFNAVNSHLRMNCLGLTCLIAMDPAAARHNFSPGSVDLLMFGRKQVSFDEQDIIEWLERVAPAGAIMVRRDDGCGAQAWGVIGARSEFARFELSGIGVAVRRDAPHESPLLQAIADPGQHDLLRKLYSHVAGHLALRAEEIESRSSGKG